MIKKYIDYDFAMSSLRIAAAISGTPNAKQQVRYAQQVFDNCPWTEAIPTAFIEKAAQKSDHPEVLLKLIQDWHEQEDDWDTINNDFLEKD